MKYLIPFFPTLSLWTPRLSAWLALKIFLTPKRHTPPQAEDFWKEKAKLETLHDLQFYRWGPASPRKILLVHGWSGRGTQMFPFVQPFVDLGFEVIAFDGPAHGRSPGAQTNAGEFSRTLAKLSQSFGEFEAVIGHSFGAGCSAFACQLGLQTKKLVLIASPANYRKIIENFLEALQFSAVGKTVFFQSLIKKAKVAPENLHVGMIGAQLKAQALIVHDRLDKEVSYQNAEENHQTWPGSELYSTSGLGHGRILKDPTTVQKIVEFVGSDGGSELGSSDPA